MSPLLNVLRRAAAVVVLAAALLALGATQASAAARSCTPPTYPGSGYFTSLKVTGGPSCATGRKVALAHYRCRTENGRRGRCERRVLRYRCRESRPSSGRTSTEYNATVTCRRGTTRKIVFTYQQNT